MKVAIFVNEKKERAESALKKVVKILKKKGATVFVQRRDGDRLIREIAPSNLKKASFVLVLGGDGTVLSACRQVACYQLPVLAVHLGGFGFLTEVEPEDIGSACERVFASNYFIDRRMMLQVSFPKRRRKYCALNDAVVAQRVFSRLCRFRILVGERELTTYAADGVILATPTGSTAYNLSALGPLVHPELSLFVLNPICAHTLYSRPIVLSATETLCVEPIGREPLILTLDGQEAVSLRPAERLFISRAPFTADLIRFEGGFFYRKIREKLKIGEERG